MCCANLIEAGGVVCKLRIGVYLCCQPFVDTRARGGKEGPMDGILLVRGQQGFRGKCHQCGKRGHKKAQCPVQQVAGASVAAAGSAGVAGWVPGVSL